MADLPVIDSSWTLFLDRDGVINRRIPGGYVTRPEDFHFLPGVTEALVKLGGLFGRLIIVTNQQGVGKGLMTADELAEVHDYMLRSVAEAGGRIDAVFHCGDLSSLPRNCRKPGISMALKAREVFPEIDLHKSVMVGDMPSDIAFGLNAGMVTVLAGTSHDTTKPMAHALVEDLSHFARLIDTADAR